MTRHQTLRAALLTLVLALFPLPLAAQDETINRYIVWFETDLPDKDFEASLTAVRNFEPVKQFLAAAENGAEAAGDDLTQRPRFSVLHAFRAVVADLPPSVADQLSNSKLPNVASVAEDFEVSAFGDEELCDDDPSDLPTVANKRTPNGVCRVGADGAATDDFSNATVYVLDSGVDNKSGLLNVDTNTSRNCLKDPCDNTNLEDKVGHGTMIAGIIGSRAPSTGAGLFGVAPWAKIVSVKIFNKRGTARFTEAPIRGLDYIWSIYSSAADDLVANVVVNISWGGSLIDELENKGGKSVVAISKRLMDLAKKGVKIVIAAGNEDFDSRLPNWVQFVFPANIGGYEPSSAKGRILTVSAIRTVQSNSSPFTWTDNWWNKSNYGTKPPDYAEPGVNVTSLWLRKNAANQTMTCSGTSFAAPHLAGVLAREIVNAGNYPLTKNGTATGDPIPPEDPIGVSKAPITARDCTP